MRKTRAVDEETDEAEAGEERGEGEEEEARESKGDGDVRLDAEGARRRTRVRSL